MFFSSIKEIKILISNGMSNIYSKVTIEKIRLSQNFNFLSLEKLSPVIFWGAPTHALNFKTFCNLKISGLGTKLRVAFLKFNFEMNYVI